jgi:hypothetical protein
MNAIEINNTENLKVSNNATDQQQQQQQQQLPVFPKASRLLLNSGNVVSSDRLKKRTNLNPEEEVIYLFIN